MKNFKNYITLSIITAALLAGMSSCVTATPQQGSYQSYNDGYNDQYDDPGFYDALSPYGQWVNYGNYGEVWRPNVGPDFQPYSTAGHWVYTDYGWTWVSDYDWGWAPFHYGRWTFDNGYGWLWVPGSEWGPAWVSWRNSNDYYGWAPLGPGMTIGASYNIPVNYWSFVPCQYVASPYVSRYYIDHGSRVNVYQHTTIINNTTVINNRTYYRGPATRDVQRYTGTTIRPVRVVNDNRPGRATVADNQVRIYRPTGAALRNRPGNMSPGRSQPNNNLPGRVNNPVPNNNQPGRVNNPPVNNNQPGRVTPNQPVNNNQPGRVNPPVNNNNQPGRVTPNQPVNNNNQPGRVNPNPGSNPPANNNQPGRAPQRIDEPRVMPSQPSRVQPQPQTQRSEPQRSQPQYQPQPSQPSRVQPQPQSQPQAQPQRVQPQPQQPRPQMQAPVQQSRPQPQQAPQRVQPQPQAAPRSAPPTPAPPSGNQQRGRSRN
jgi:hypothetical protein